jgi:uncharacterized protein YndB with AHSA1/START domain
VIEIRHNITIAATPERIWEVISQADKFADWFPRLKEVRNPQGEPGEVGSTYEIVYELPTGHQVEGRSEIIKAERPRYIVEHFQVADNISGEGRWRFSRQRGEDSTHLELQATIDIPGGTISDLAEPLIAATIRAEAMNVIERFKEICERQPTEVRG